MDAEIQSSREDACPERSEGVTASISKCLATPRKSRLSRRGQFGEQCQRLSRWYGDQP